MTDAVADAVRIVRESGLPNHTDAMFTTIEATGTSAWTLSGGVSKPYVHGPGSPRPRRRTSAGPDRGELTASSRAPESRTVTPLDFGPIERAEILWERALGCRPAHTTMAAATSVMRVQQLPLVAAFDALAARHGLTFARYEALVLLAFSREGQLSDVPHR